MQRQKITRLWLIRCNCGRIGAYSYISPSMHVQTFLACHDAAVAPISPHTRATFVAMLASTVARLLAAEIAFRATVNSCV